MSQGIWETSWFTTLNLLMYYFHGQIYRLKNWKCLRTAKGSGNFLCKDNQESGRWQTTQPFLIPIHASKSRLSGHPGSLAVFPWRWCRCVGLSVSRVPEKQVLGRSEFNHHPRIVLIPCHGGSRNTFCSYQGPPYFPPFIWLKWPEERRTLVQVKISKSLK